MLKTLSLSIFCVVALAFSALVGCSEDVGFTGGTAADSESETTALYQAENQKTENFSALGNQLGAMDMVWVIDNSGSMNEEASHVRTNLEAFIQHIDSRADVKMAVISKKGNYGNGVQLPAGLDPERFTHIEHVVTSTNGLQLLDHYLNNDLKTFLRPDVDKAFVIVSDDNSKMSGDDFIQSFHQTSPELGFTLHGFIAADKKNSPCGARQGGVYEYLIETTKGVNFNICEPDWTAQFSSLASSVIEQVRTSFKLDSSVIAEAVSSVTVNGTALGTDKFQMTDNVLSINNSALQGSDKFAIEVTYRFSQR